MRISAMQILVLLLIVVVLFGASRLPSVARNLGKSMRIMKEEVRDLRDDAKDAPKDEPTDAPVNAPSDAPVNAPSDAPARAASTTPPTPTPSAPPADPDRPTAP